MSRTQYAEIIARHADRKHNPRPRPADVALINSNRKA